MKREIVKRLETAERRAGVRRQRYVLRGDEQPTAEEIASGQRFMRAPNKMSLDEWKQTYGGETN